MARFKYETLDKRIVDFYKEVFLVIGYKPFHYGYSDYSSTAIPLRLTPKWESFLRGVHPITESALTYGIAEFDGKYLHFTPHFIDWAFNEK